MDEYNKKPGTPREFGAGGPNSRRRRILLADDNAETRDYMHRLLSDRYDVEPTIDGMSALTSAQRNPPDLVLTDATLPGLDGLSLIRELRAHPQTSGVPVLLVSALVDDNVSRTNALGAGADDYLEKPFSADELLSTIRTLLGGKS